MRTRLERAIDKRDDLEHYIREWGWARTPSQLRALDRQLAKAQAKVDRLSSPPACDTCSDTGLIDWMVESDPNLYQEPDADGHVPCPDCANKTTQPHGLGSTKGEEDGKQGGVHPDRAREAAEGPDGRGVHGGSGVLDRPGHDPQGRVSDRSGRGLTDGSPGGLMSPGDAPPEISSPPEPELPEWERELLLRERARSESTCPCGCPVDMHIGDIGCPCALPGEPPCVSTPPEV